jgi:hypothetical protein
MEVSTASTTKPDTSKNERTADAKISAAIIPTRSLWTYTLTATLPIAVVAALLLFGAPRAWSAMAAVIAAGVSMVAFWRLLYEMTYDIAGFPEYKLPVWSVLYLIVYLISGFAFTIFALASSFVGDFVGGISSNPKTSFLDSLYLSLSNYIGVAPDASFSWKSQGARFLSVTQGVLSMFLNIVVITKFVSAF